MAKGVHYAYGDPVNISTEGEPIYDTVGTQYGGVFPAYKLSPQLRREAVDVLGWGRSGDEIVMNYAPEACVVDPEGAGQTTRVSPFCMFDVHRYEPDMMVHTIYTVHKMLDEPEEATYIGETETFYVAAEIEEPPEDPDDSALIVLDPEEDDPPDLDEIEFSGADLGSLEEPMSAQQAFTLRRIVWLAGRWSTLRATDFMLENRLGRPRG